MAKKNTSISLPNSNLYLKGKGNDTNGNSIVKLHFPNQRAFSIQTNGSLPKSHWDLIHAKSIHDLKPKFLETLEKEVAHYVSNFGSKKQKDSLMMSADLKQKIKRMKSGGAIPEHMGASDLETFAKGGSTQGKKDQAFYDFVDSFINEYNVSEQTAFREAYDELGYKPKFARDEYKKGGKIKKFPVAIKRRVEELNDLIKWAEDKDNFVYSDMGSTWGSYLIFKKPVAIKNQFVYVEYDNGHDRKPVKERYNVNQEWSLDELKYTLSQILRAYRKAKKDFDKKGYFKSGGEIVEEYSIRTNFSDEDFDNEQDAREFWEDLSQEERDSGQFFRKVWIDGEEDEVELLYAKGGEIGAKVGKLLKSLEKAFKDKNGEKFSSISDEIHRISDNEGLTKKEYDKWDSIREKERKYQFDKFGSSYAEGGEIMFGSKWIKKGASPKTIYNIDNIDGDRIYFHSSRGTHYQRTRENFLKDYSKKGGSMASGGGVDEELTRVSAKSIYDRKGIMGLRNTFLQLANTDEKLGNKELAKLRRDIVAEYQSKQPSIRAKGGSVRRNNNSPLLRYINFEDGWHINLKKLKSSMNQNGKPYKGNNKYGIIRQGGGQKPEVWEFKTLIEAETKFNELVELGKTYSKIEKQGKIKRMKTGGEVEFADDMKYERYVQNVISHATEYDNGDGYSERFKGATNKIGDKTNGNFTMEGNQLIWVYVDSKGREYTSDEQPSFRIDMGSLIHKRTYAKGGLIYEIHSKHSDSDEPYEHDNNLQSWSTYKSAKAIADQLNKDSNGRFKFKVVKKMKSGGSIEDVYYDVFAGFGDNIGTATLESFDTKKEAESFKRKIEAKKSGTVSSAHGDLPVELITGVYIEKIDGSKYKKGGQAGRKIEESQYIDEDDESGEIKYYNGDQAYELIKSILIQDEDALRGRDIESISTDEIFEYGYTINIYQNPDWDRLDEQILVGRIHPDIAVQPFIPHYERKFIDVYTKISRDGFTEIYGQKKI